MDLQIRRFEEIPAQAWDAWARALPEAAYAHSSMYLRFCHRMVGQERSHSFAALDNEGSLVALCPLGFSSGEVDGQAFCEASWNGIPLAVPAVRSELPSQRRRLVAAVFEVLHHEMRKSGVARSLLLKHPMSMAVLQGAGQPAGQMEALSGGYACQAQNTIILDLRRSREELELGLTHEQRKHMRQSVKRGLEVREFGAESRELAAMHEQYRLAHRKAAGRLTRPEASFEIMLELAQEGQMRLFAAFTGQTAVAFLYCGEFEGFGFGWSQANAAEYASEYAARHLLEWSAVLSYQARGFKYYEIGRRFYGPQPYKVPTPKELSISFFKERYGGQLWPYLVFEQFFDQRVCQLVHEKRLREYLEGLRFDPQTRQEPAAQPQEAPR